MIYTAQNSDAAILSNICSTLSSIRDVSILTAMISSLTGIADGAGECVPLLCDANWTPCTLNLATLTAQQLDVMTLAQYLALVGVCSVPTVTVQFFIDPEMTNELFSVNTVDNQDCFVVAKGNRLLFAPLPTMINDSGDGMAQPEYYVKITEAFDPPIVTNKTYSNSENLLFSSVVVSTKKNPEFAKAGSQLILVPGEQKQSNLSLSDQLGYMIYDYDLYIQLPIYNWKNLSELDRVIAAMNANNLVRLALYADKYRAGKCTFYSADVDGTFVGQMNLLPSPDVLRGVIHVRCASYVSNTSY